MALINDYLVLERPHPSAFIGGVQRIYRFPDGHGLSIVNGPILHIGPFAWEVAVLENVSTNGLKFDLTYSTELTNDVEVFCNDEETNNFINKAIDLFVNEGVVKNEDIPDGKDRNKRL